jgi:hypothetical protein
MVLLAMVPPSWRRVMDRRVLDRHSGEIRLAALSPAAKRVAIGTVSAAPTDRLLTTVENQASRDGVVSSGRCNTS